MKPIIDIRGIGKKYDIQHMQGGYIALRDVLANVFKNPFKFATHKVKHAIGLSKKEEFWALKDINLSIEKGEIVGIIGANGAGKSTLLKILTGITPPTEGEIIMRGRVSSLLEVGTGFHPELTGRENIFLNGAILGMTKAEIEKNFDAIVQFAGIEKFLDTPVKRYSSGMYVRLAFSVAAHMEPDILLVDEVLAVGDAEFQKKCLGKMEEVTRERGRTILFVSHNLGTIKQLCTRTILLKNGQVAFEGETEKAIAHYTHAQGKEGVSDLKKNINRSGDGSIRLTEFHMENKHGATTNTFKHGEGVSFVFKYTCKNPEDIKNVDVGFSIDKNANLASVVYNSYTKDRLPPLEQAGEIKFTTDNLLLAPGIYNVGVRILANGIEADRFIESIGSFEVLPSDEYIQKEFTTNPSSIVLIKGTWSSH